MDDTPEIPSQVATRPVRIRQSYPLTPFTADAVPFLYSREKVWAYFRSPAPMVRALPLASGEVPIPDRPPIQNYE